MDQQNERTPAASMSLLVRVIDDALDPGYQRSKEQPPTYKQTRRYLWNALIFVLAVGLMWGATVSAKALYSATAGAPEAGDELAGQVSRASDTVTRLEEENEALEERIASIQPEGETSLQSSGLQVAAATSRISGPGMTLTIADNFGGGTPLIRDRDIRTLLNALWSGGAEAIAIDGLRIGPQTSVRTAGSSILVNLQPLSSPYVIEAIGNAETMKAALSREAAASAVKNLEESLGMSITTTTSSNLTFGALRATQVWYAQPQEGEQPDNQGDDPQ